METFAKLFGSLLALVYHCFDRIVILGHLPLLTRPENIVHFFRDIHQVSTISKEALRQRTDDYHRGVEAFAKKRKIPMEWAEKGVRKEDYIRPHLRRMERRHQFGVYFILKSMELGPSFRSAVPRFPVDDPHYRILARQRSRYTHYYFYIRDEVLGPVPCAWDCCRLSCDTCCSSIQPPSPGAGLCPGDRSDALWHGDRPIRRSRSQSRDLDQKHRYRSHARCHD